LFPAGVIQIEAKPDGWWHATNVPAIIVGRITAASRARLIVLSGDAGAPKRGSIAQGQQSLAEM
jgi:hypothetical protein